MSDLTSINSLLESGAEKTNPPMLFLFSIQIFLNLPLLLLLIDYPGTVFAFANTIANLAGIFGPKTVTWLVTDSREHSSWFSLWAFSGVLFFTGGFIFCLFADNKPQNYCKKSHKASSLSTAQLVNAPVSKGEPIEEIFKMDAFSRVASEPNPKNIGEQQHRD